MAHPVVFDRPLLRARRVRAAALGPSTFLLERVAEDLADRLATVLRRFEVAVDLGTPTDAVGWVLAASGKVGTAVRAAQQAGDRAVAVVADEEALPFADGALDLVVSALALQFVNDLPGTLIQIRRALRPDGLLLAALAGGDTLTELRQRHVGGEPQGRPQGRAQSGQSPDRDFGSFQLPLLQLPLHHPTVPPQAANLNAAVRVKKNDGIAAPDRL